MLISITPTSAVTKSSEHKMYGGAPYQWPAHVDYHTPRYFNQLGTAVMSAIPGVPQVIQQVAAAWPSQDYNTNWQTPFVSHLPPPQQQATRPPPTTGGITAVRRHRHSHHRVIESMFQMMTTMFQKVIAELRVPVPGNVARPPPPPPPPPPHLRTSQHQPPSAVQQQVPPAVPPVAVSRLIPMPPHLENMLTRDETVFRESSPEGLVPIDPSSPQVFSSDDGESSEHSPQGTEMIVDVLTTPLSFGRSQPVPWPAETSSGSSMQSSVKEAEEICKCCGQRKSTPVTLASAAAAAVGKAAS